MQKVAIVEAIQNMVEEKIFKEWKHEGYINGCYSNGVAVNIDGKDYLIEIKESEGM